MLKHELSPFNLINHFEHCFSESMKSEDDYQCISRPEIYLIYSRLTLITLYAIQIGVFKDLLTAENFNFTNIIIDNLDIDLKIMLSLCRYGYTTENWEIDNDKRMRIIYDYSLNDLIQKFAEINLKEAKICKEMAVTLLYELGFIHNGLNNDNLNSNDAVRLLK